MKFSMKKSALALSIAAAFGASATVSAVEIESFESVGIKAEFYNTATGEEVDLGDSPRFSISAGTLNPSSIVLSSSEAALSAPQNDNYFLAVVTDANDDGTDELAGVVVRSDDQTLAVSGGAVDGNIQFVNTGGLNVRLLEDDGVGGLQLADSVNLTPQMRLVVVDVAVATEADFVTAVDAETYGDAALNSTDSIRLIAPPALGLNDSLSITIEQSSGQSDSTVAATVAPFYSIRATDPFAGVIDVNADRLSFTEGSAVDAQNDQADLTLAASEDNYATALDETARTIALSVVASNQNLELTIDTALGGSTLGEYDAGAWPITGIDTDDADGTLTLNAETDSETVIDERVFAFSASTESAQDRLNVTYADGSSLGEWTLNGHVAYLPYFPTGTVAAQLRVTNQSDEDNAAVTIDAWDQTGAQVASNVEIGRVPANGILTVFKSDVVEALTATPNGPISVRIVTNAPQDSVMVSGNQIVGGQGMTDLRTYNGAGAAAIELTCTEAGVGGFADACTGSGSTQRFR